MSEDSTVRVERGPFEMVPHWLLYDLSVNALAIRLYLVLRQHADASGECFPSRQRLCDLLGVSLPTLDKARNQLVEAGAITIRQRKDDARQYASSLYVVHWDRQDSYIRGVKFFTGGSQDSYALTHTQRTHTQVTTNTVKADDGTERREPPSTPAAPSGTPLVGENGGPPLDGPTRPGGSPAPLGRSGRGSAPHGAREAPHLPVNGGSDPGDIPPRVPVRQGQEAYPAGFAAFWNAYPRKAGKKAALAAWKKATKEVSEDQLIEAAHRYASDPNREQKYTPHPATWLRQGRWEDEPLPSASVSKQMTGGQRRMSAYNEIYQAISQRKGIEQ